MCVLLESDGEEKAKEAGGKGGHGEKKKQHQVEPLVEKNSRGRVFFLTNEKNPVLSRLYNGFLFVTLSLLRLSRLFNLLYYSCWILHCGLYSFSVLFSCVLNFLHAS